MRASRRTRQRIDAQVAALKAAGALKVVPRDRERREALDALASGAATQADLARRFNVSQSTISRLAT